jgi:DNA mismatch endonuclease (patch repair protein)
MTDVFTKEKRSEVMSLIRGKGNKATELALISIFKRLKISGWRRNSPLFGRPDFVFRKQRLVVFVDGEFWHGHPKRSVIPIANRDFWRKKIERNKMRDRLVNQTLKAKGWKVVRIWQRDIAGLSWLKKLR